MRSKLAVLGLLAFVLIGVPWRVTRGRAAEAETAPQGTARQDVELTVYAQDFGMVRELRPLQLAKGSNRLRVPDVSKTLDPHSVLLRWQGDAPNPPQLVAHSYDLGVGSSGDLLKRYLGKEVELVRYAPNGREADRQRGTLMVEADGGVVVQTDGRFYVHPDGTLVAPANADIVTIPQLSVQAESPAAQTTNLEVAYLTRGLSWSADYVATLSPSSNSLALECWATVTNRTGVDYPNANVSLMAGTPNRAATPATAGRFPALASLGFEEIEARVAHRPAALSPAVGGGQPEPVGDFHAYQIKNPTTVAQEQMNRLLMLASSRVLVIRDYSATLPALTAYDDSYSWGTPGQPQRGGVEVALTFFNREKAGLGVPLPQGAMRLYEPDRSGALRYAGAATVENTPRDQKVQVTLARAFDLFTEARLVKKQRVKKHTIRKQIEVVLHNEKPTAAELRVVQGFGGRWKILQESHPHVNLDANSAQWPVKLPPSGKATLGYTVDLTG
jgi:hypothetical protein